MKRRDFLKGAVALPVAVTVLPFGMVGPLPRDGWTDFIAVSTWDTKEEALVQGWLEVTAGLRRAFKQGGYTETLPWHIGTSYDPSARDWLVTGIASFR